MSIQVIRVIIALVWLPTPVLAALFWHTRVYSLYGLLGERWPEIEQQVLRGRHQTQQVRRESIPRPAGRLSYYWFAFQFQTPHFARQLPGYVDLFGSLPEDLAARASVVRRQTKRIELISWCWTLLLVAILIGLSFRR